MRTFRDTILRISPPWLTDFVGSRLLYALGVQLDALGDDLVTGMKLSYPDFAAEFYQEALAFIGRDRRIYQGPEESDEHYAGRLKAWLDEWPTAGNAYTLMRQIQGYLHPHEVKLRVVNSRGAWRTLNPDGSTEYHRAAPTNFTWDGQDGTLITRFWVIIYPPASLWTIGPTWSSQWTTNWGKGNYTWGSTATPEQVRAIRNIIAEWQSAAGACTRIVLAFDPDSFDPTSSPGAPMPDGTWGQFSDSAAPRGKARLATARYWRGPT